MAGVELIESGKDILQYKSIVDEALSKDLTGDSQELMSICDLERMNIPERKTLISEWLKDKSYMIVCARRGVGKTHFTWGIAKAVSLNLEFSHWKRGNLDEEYPNVMILDGEMPIEELIERQRSHRMPKNIYIRSAVYQEDYRNYKGLLLNENYRNLIHRQCQEHNIRLLILDNKSSFHPGMEENANGNEWDNVNSWILEMRNQGINVILVTHSGKDEKRGTRGGSSIEDNADVVVQLYDKKKNNNTENVCFEIQFTKCRFYVPYHDIQSKIMEFSPGSSGKYEWKTHQSQEALREGIQNRIDKGMKYKDIAQEMGISTGKISKIKKLMN